MPFGFNYHLQISIPVLSPELHTIICNCLLCISASDLTCPDALSFCSSKPAPLAALNRLSQQQLHLLANQVANFEVTFDTCLSFLLGFQFFGGSHYFYFLKYSYKLIIFYYLYCYHPWIIKGIWLELSSQPSCCYIIPASRLSFPTKGISLCFKKGNQIRFAQNPTMVPVVHCKMVP